MDKSMVKGLVLGGVAMVVLGAGAVSGYKTLAKPSQADVVAVRDVTETVTTPRQVCGEVAVTRQAPVQDPNRVTGTIVGGIAGGLLGSNIGGGDGKKVATVAGAALGGYAGNRVQKNMQERDTVTTTEQRCRTVNERVSKVVGYDVTYRLAGKEAVVRLPYKPGATVWVKDGEVVSTPSAGPQA